LHRFNIVSGGFSLATPDVPADARFAPESDGSGLQRNSPRVHGLRDRNNCLVL
jgi:hypothetical protein